ncbi:hypothetical protein TNCV_492841 [Trichonephila clavipes]|nr:hypothetical protein TNCV_492841 [Trichonephila clavipes]
MSITIKRYVNAMRNRWTRANLQMALHVQFRHPVRCGVVLGNGSFQAVSRGKVAAGNGRPCAPHDHLHVSH